MVCRQSVVLAGVLGALALTVHASACHPGRTTQAADTPQAQAQAQAYNAAFEAGATNGITPETLGEMLTCAAVWDRWHYAVESAADPAFTDALRSELASGNAATRSAYWQGQARRDVTEEEEEYFARARARAETEADRLYAAYANNEEKGMENLLDWLGTCR